MRNIKKGWNAEKESILSTLPLVGLILFMLLPAALIDWQIYLLVAGILVWACVCLFGAFILDILE